MSSYWTLLSKSCPLLLKGALMTVQVLVVSALVSFTVGLILGIFSCERLRIRFISPLIEATTFVCRAVPFFVQLLIVYFVLPDIFGWNVEPFPASVIALGICSSGYVMQIVRAGINSIPASQWESAYSLGYSTYKSLQWIILPQVFRHILPACTNEIDSLLKSTAIVSSIGMLELTRMGMNIVSREMQPVPIYLMVAFFYVCMSGVFNLVARNIERKIAYVKR